MRRNRRPIVAAGVVLASLGLLAGVFWGGSVLAQQQYDVSAAVSETAADERAQAESAYEARMRSGTGELDRVGSVVATAEFGADGSGEAATLRAAFDALTALGQATPGGGNAESAGDADGAEDPGDADADASDSEASDNDAGDADAGDTGASDTAASDTGYQPPWELLAEAGELSAEAREDAAERDELIAATAAADEAQDAIDDAEVAYFQAVADRGTSEIASNSLATKQSQVALTRLIEQASDAGSSGTRDGAFLASFVAAENALAASQAEEAAEAADPALAVRRDVEAYARSMSNGITLDFVWAPEVNGLGEGWYSGTAQTWDSDGGWAIITLNYDVERFWGDDENARALVTHEVGHTQAYRDTCWPLFSGPTFGQDQEMWATAWAISQGFDMPGSGIEAYGRPSDEQIAVAGQCR